LNKLPALSAPSCQMRIELVELLAPKFAKLLPSLCGWRRLGLRCRILHSGASRSASEHHPSKHEDNIRHPFHTTSCGRNRPSATFEALPTTELEIRRFPRAALGQRGRTLGGAAENGSGTTGRAPQVQVGRSRLGGPVERGAPSAPQAEPLTIAPRMQRGARPPARSAGPPNTGNAQTGAPPKLRRGGETRRAGPVRPKRGITPPRKGRSRRRRGGRAASRPPGQEARPRDRA
jgi:hypothetical protein